MAIEESARKASATRAREKPSPMAVALPRDAEAFKQRPIGAVVSDPPTTTSGSATGSRLLPTANRWTTWRRAYLSLLVSADVAVGALAVILAAVLGPHELVTSDHAADVTWLAALSWPLAIFVTNGYQRRHFGVTSEQSRAVLRAVVGLFAAFAAMAVATNVSLSRTYLAVLLPTLLVGGLLSRTVLSCWLACRRRSGHMMQRAVVVGRADAAAELVRLLNRNTAQGLQPVAVCASGMETELDAATSIQGVPVMGGPQDTAAAVHLCGAEAVVVSSHPKLAGRALRRLAWSLEESRVDLLVSPGLLDVAGSRLSIRPSEGLSLLHIERPAATPAHAVGKTVLDRSLAILLLLVLAPFFAVIAVAIKLTSPGPVLYKQARIGRAGRPFFILKFRTMLVDADKQLDALRHLNEGNLVQFKLRNDPRVTSVGRLLRRFSMDELPQLLNVVCGEMSLVGPRPQTRREVDQYEPDAVRRLHVRPGLTGLWQVSGRSDLDWEQSTSLDLRYVDNWSPLMDLSIMCRTLRAVIRGTGAY